MTKNDKLDAIKVLIAEEYNHFKVLENTYHLLKNHCDLTFYINKSGLRKCGLLFPSSKEAKIIFNNFHSSTFFVWLLFHARKFDYVNVSTGPEGDHYSEIVNVICFYLCCALYGNKIILTIKNIPPYLKSTRGLFSFLRNKCLKKLKWFTFETITMREAFKKHARLKNSLLGVSYDRYTDLLDKETCKIRAKENHEAVRVGLLGTIAPDRRDYRGICDALGELSLEDRPKIELVILGMCHGGCDNDVIKGLKGLVRVDCCKEILSAEEFDERGISCDILISPLKADRNYGTFKGSGSLGDALYLRKKIILPAYVDPEKEFEEIAIYYQNKQELLDIFRNIQQLSRGQVDPAYYEQFTTKNVFDNLIKDLMLCG